MDTSAFTNADAYINAHTNAPVDATAMANNVRSTPTTPTTAMTTTAEAHQSALLQRLLAISKSRHDKLTKDMMQYLDAFNSNMEQDLSFIIKEYVQARVALEKANLEIKKLQEENAALASLGTESPSTSLPRLEGNSPEMQNALSTAATPGATVGLGITSQPTVSLGSMQQQLFYMRQLHERELQEERQKYEIAAGELQMTTQELVRALEDVEVLKESKKALETRVVQMQSKLQELEDSVENKSVVNYQLDALLKARTSDADRMKRERDYYQRGLEAVSKELNTSRQLIQIFSKYAPSLAALQQAQGRTATALQSPPNRALPSSPATPVLASQSAFSSGPPIPVVQGMQGPPIGKFTQAITPPSSTQPQGQPWGQPRPHPPIQSYTSAPTQPGALPVTSAGSPREVTPTSKLTSTAPSVSVLPAFSVAPTVAQADLQPIFLLQPSPVKALEQQGGKPQAPSVQKPASSKEKRASKQTKEPKQAQVPPTQVPPTQTPPTQTPATQGSSTQSSPTQSLSAPALPTQTQPCQTQAPTQSLPLTAICIAANSVDPTSSSESQSVPTLTIPSAAVGFSLTLQEKQQREKHANRLAQASQLLQVQQRQQQIKQQEVLRLQNDIREKAERTKQAHHAQKAEQERQKEMEQLKEIHQSRIEAFLSKSKANVGNGSSSESAASAVSSEPTSPDTPAPAPPQQASSAPQGEEPKLSTTAMHTLDTDRVQLASANTSDSALPQRTSPVPQGEEHHLSTLPVDRHVADEVQDTSVNIPAPVPEKQARSLNGGRRRLLSVSADGHDMDIDWEKDVSGPDSAAGTPPAPGKSRLENSVSQAPLVSAAATITDSSGAFQLSGASMPIPSVKPSSITVTSFPRVISKAKKPKFPAFEEPPVPPAKRKVGRSRKETRSQALTDDIWSEEEEPQVQDRETISPQRSPRPRKRVKSLPGRFLVSAVEIPMRSKKAIIGTTVSKASAGGTEDGDGATATARAGTGTEETGSGLTGGAGRVRHGRKLSTESVISITSSSNSSSSSSSSSSSRSGSSGRRVVSRSRSPTSSSKPLPVSRVSKDVRDWIHGLSDEEDDGGMDQDSKVKALSESTAAKTGTGVQDSLLTGASAIPASPASIKATALPRSILSQASSFMIKLSDVAAAKRNLVPGSLATIDLSVNGVNKDRSGAASASGGNRNDSAP
ncbi:hypothetical protein BGX28_007719 [Mortierella sp. GBA30]|nr:hypothetical protein BGX28_007719 [Mortierella sp. GBA30]